MLGVKVRVAVTLRGWRYNRAVPALTKSLAGKTEEMAGAIGWFLPVDKFLRRVILQDVHFTVSEQRNIIAHEYRSLTVIFRGG